MKTPIEQVHELGQSFWYDNIERRLLENGELASLISRGDIRGITSNPTIFNNAIAKSNTYDPALFSMAWAGITSLQIYDRLTIEDITAAADLFLPLYRSSQGGDGYVSLEVSPLLAHNTKGTVAEALRLWHAVDRPNLMVKIPATSEGIPAIRQAIAAGVNVNVTLIFSMARYREVMDAYLCGLEDRLAAYLPLENIASVASFFVSRIDTKADKALLALTQSKNARATSASHLFGKLAIANARLAYQQFRAVFGGDRFTHLKASGARLQRPLWASTGAKNPNYSATMYLDELIGPDTINTVPPQTLEAFRQQGKATLTLAEGLESARQVFAEAGSLGISIDQITQELETEGVQLFTDSFNALMATIETRRLEARAGLSYLAQPVAERVKALEQMNASARMAAVDPTLWTEDPQGQVEIRKRLGWLNLPETSRLMLPELEAFKQELLAAGFTHVLLLGMGGSSLAPEVMRLVFGKPAAGLDLSIVDSTDPAQIRAAARRSPVQRTVYIVSSKSGGTAEVNAFLDYFWAHAHRSVGKAVGEHFIAITDPGTSLDKLARERGFRKVFLADPGVGGRYSALTAFGLVPAALMDIDMNRFLDHAAWVAKECLPSVPASCNPGLVLGAVLGESARRGRAKLTLILDPEVSSFGSWLEQLVAESSGKHGVGIVPVDGEPPAGPGVYGQDRLFVYLRSSGKFDLRVARLQKFGQPVLVYSFNNPYNLAAEFYRWEIATALACAILGVNAFDQPDVQDSKNRTVAKIKQFKEHGRLDEGPLLWEQGGIRLYGKLPGSLEGVQDLGPVIVRFLAQARAGDYVGLNAYIPRNAHNAALLRQMRVAIRKRTDLATTVGFGPRFQHSTGQLHKGGANNGVFLQITLDADADMEIPGEGLTFGTLERAQALGDLEALLVKGRRALRVHCSSQADLFKLLEALEQ